MLNRPEDFWLLCGRLLDHAIARASSYRVLGSVAEAPPPEWTENWKQHVASSAVRQVRPGCPLWRHSLSGFLLQPSYPIIPVPLLRRYIPVFAGRASVKL